MHYVYVLRSKKDRKFYTGYTADLIKRMEAHNKGLVESTKNRRPLELIYYEACATQQDALHREKYLKTAYGKRYIKNRLKEYLDALD
jgi:putative endonuclease